ncbi:hypothetical protein X925_08020 [Petrotoga sp. 9T1HF07.CasAA.8.2]|jgi:type I restriction enzyme S subunit|uniref:restriction endonuclease subunit S n=1 Tax=Petrotoga sp. 9T1HF07.CasAA.8.2 TaxID=1434329 RepID=UPI000CC3D517|nr:restriction endonuclease subunit S [Petrotoga sp. 9T1HF07.CasAA.8.2]PNR87802.1 hypothetical protein X925_08020 [Petrotoga sp. 9T1HF07.CasAA.8.2]
MKLDLNQKEEYKETELGLLPKDWEVVKLGEVSELQQGKTPKRDDYEDYKGYRIIKVKDYENENKISNIIKGDRSFVKTDFGERCRIKEGDSLILSAAHSSNIVGQKIGYVKEIPSQKTFFVAELIRVRPKKNIIPYFCFLSLILMSSRNQIREEVKGGHLYPKNLGKIRIPLPPLSEQKKIAYVLSSVQEAKEKTEDVIKATKELKKSMMKYLFTYGPVSLEEVEKVPLKETEIGLVPEKWEVVRLGDVFEIKQGKQLSSKESVENKIKKPFLRTSNITWGKIDISKIDFMYFNKEEFEKLRLKIGDVLVCEGGDIGRTALYRGELKEAAYQNHLHRLRPREEGVSEEFFVFWMDHAINQRQMYLYTANRTTIPNLSSSRLKNFKIPLPPLPIQQKIASILSAIDQKIEAEESKKKALEDLFKSLLHNLMTAKIRVNHLENVFDE